MLQFWAFWLHFLAHFGTLFYFLSFFLSLTIWVFWAFHAVLSGIRLVVIYSLFWVKYFWHIPYLCKKEVFLHVGPHYSAPKTITTATTATTNTPQYSVQCTVHSRVNTIFFFVNYRHVGRPGTVWVCISPSVKTKIALVNTI